MNTILDKYYDQVSNKFDKIRFDFEEEIKSHCLWFMSNRNWLGKTLLDVGCGTGRYTKEFASIGMLSMGIDNSFSQLSVAIQKVPVIYGDALSLPFANDSFDAISCIMMIHQIKAYNFEKLFQDIYLKLKPNGVFWIKTCSHQDLYRRPFNKYFPSSLNINSERYPEISSLNSLIISNKYELLRETNICDQYNLKGFEILNRFKDKHNSTLHLLSDNEFKNGLNMIQKDYNPEKTFTISHYHTLLEFIKK